MRHGACDYSMVLAMIVLQLPGTTLGSIVGGDPSGVFGSTFDAAGEDIKCANTTSCGSNTNVDANLVSPGGFLFDADRLGPTTSIDRASANSLRGVFAPPVFGTLRPSNRSSLN